MRVADEVYREIVPTAVLETPMERGVAAGFDKARRMPGVDRVTVFRMKLPRSRRYPPEEDMPVIDTPKIVQTAAQATAVVHVTCPRSEIRNVMGPGYKELMDTLGAQGIVPAGRWFTHHLRMRPDTFDFEIGVPVTKPVAAAGRVTAGQLPAATVARTIYHGPYEGLSSAWEQLGAWITAQRRTAGPSLWETYLTDPSSNPDPTTWLTELTRPLVG
jgi:effector-binding domain-containing protein